MKLFKNVAVLIDMCPSERRDSTRYNVLVPCYISGIPLPVFTMRDVSESGCRLHLTLDAAPNTLREGNNYVINVQPTQLTNENLNINSFRLQVNLVWLTKHEHEIGCGFRILKSESKDFNTWLNSIASHTKEKKLLHKRLV